MLTQGYLNSQAYCHNLVRRDWDLMQVSSVIIHYTDDVNIRTQKSRRGLV